MRIRLATFNIEIAVDNAALLDETEPAAVGARRPGAYHAPVVAEFEVP